MHAMLFDLKVQSTDIKLPLQETCNEKGFHRRRLTETRRELPLSEFAMQAPSAAHAPAPPITLYTDGLSDA